MKAGSPDGSLFELRILINTVLERPDSRPPGKRIEVMTQAWQTVRWLMIV
jgi:hypothetical protein